VIIEWLLGVGLILLFAWLFRQKYEMEKAFKSLSLEVLQKTQSSLLEVAKSDLSHRHQAIEAALEPVAQAMKQLDLHQRALEQKREGAYATLRQQIEHLIEAEKALRQETQTLATALRSPIARGAWGQVALRRIVELAGMVPHADFSEQATVSSDGKTQRPDLVVRLPGGRHLVVDAKAPLDAYIAASEAKDETHRRRLLQDHVSALRSHLRDLGKKEYWKQFDLTPEFTILFLPSEAIFSAALHTDPSLIEQGADQNIALATPTTLIPILRTIAFSWKQDSLSKSAKEISRLGQELYERIGPLCDHLTRLGKSLNSAVDSYNQTLSSLETRVLVTARKLKESGSLLKETPTLPLIETLARSPVSPDPSAKE
jgi:DNA recombination protein RmuC